MDTVEAYRVLQPVCMVALNAPFGRLGPVQPVEPVEPVGPVELVQLIQVIQVTFDAAIGQLWTLARAKTQP